MLFDLSNRIKAVPPEFSRFLILHQPAFLKNQAGAKFRLVWISCIHYRLRLTVPFAENGTIG